MSTAIRRRDLLRAGLAYSSVSMLSKASESLPEAVDHAVTVISGSPRERGRNYGRAFREPIRKFLDREIVSPFVGKPASLDEMMRFADRCATEVRRFSPALFEEVEGVAEGTELTVEQIILLNSHEELWHKGLIPSVAHCTAIAAGPPDTKDGATYVGQTWDWMPSVYGLSSMLHWKRAAKEGPSVLAYSYPGLWVGAGLNSAGLALCWTSATGTKHAGPRVGVPAYLLIAQMMYQETLEAAAEEAKRAKHSGWFTFVLADATGKLMNVEGTPDDLEVEYGRGHMTRVSYGSRRLTQTKPGTEVPKHPRCARVVESLDAMRGEIDRDAFRRLFSDHGDSARPATKVCVHPNTLDAMIFNTNKKEAWVTRGPGCSNRWRRFGFEQA